MPDAQSRQITFDFLGLPRELRDMIYNLILHKPEENPSPRWPSHLSVIYMCKSADPVREAMLKLKRANVVPGIKLRQVCKAMRDEIDHKIAVDSVLRLRTDLSSAEFKVLGVPFRPVPQLLCRTIKRLEIRVFMEEEYFTTQSDWTWIAEMKELEQIFISMSTYARSSVVDRRSLALGGLIADILSHTHAAVKFRWGSSTKEQPEKINVVQCEELSAVAGDLDMLQGVLVNSAGIGKTDSS